jgi:AcrR family transcriptional regulator
MNIRKSSEDRTAEILVTTLELAFEVGPDHVTTGMIAGRLGLTQPAIYKHFPKKEDVWNAVSETLCARIVANAKIDVSDGQAPIVRLRQLVASHIHLVTEFPALPEIMVARDPTGTLTDARHRIQRAMADFRVAIGWALEQASAANHLREGLSVEDGVSLLFGVIQSLVLRLIVSRNPTNLAQDSERLLDLQILLFMNKGVGV